MRDTLKHILMQMANSLDGENSYITDDDVEVLIKLCSKISFGNVLSKYQACSHLKISRATFDNLIRNGEIPKGQKKQGFKELFWYKNDLDKYKRQVAKNKPLTFNDIM